MHQPILLNEVLEHLVTEADGLYIDGTFGRGGHSKALLSRLDEQGRLVVFDRDQQAIEAAKHMAETDGRITVQQRPFSAMREVVEGLGCLNQVNGILLDLGVSSPQLDEAERGFSFRFEGPLDMRMDQSQSESAETWLAHVSEAELSLIIRDLGEEKFHRRIAQAIVLSRDEQPITTTDALVAIIKKCCPHYERGKHPATRTFQAIRMHINQELAQLKQVLDDALDMLAVGGRMAVIGFHSLEHKAVKTFAKQYCSGNEVIEIGQNPKKPRLRRVVRHVAPSLMEVAQNPRARSAILRVLEKVA